jgi:hypothetical protein
LQKSEGRSRACPETVAILSAVASPGARTCQLTTSLRPGQRNEEAFLRFDCAMMKRITCWLVEENTTGCNWFGDSLTALKYDQF